jgi:hypothetical protein
MVYFVERCQLLKLLLAKAVFTLWLEIFIRWQRAVSFLKVLPKRHLSCVKKFKKRELLAVT